MAEAAAPAPAPAAAPASALGPRPEGVEAMDWPQLQAAVATCRACGLCAGRTQTVFGAGSRRADWMVVGEAPGETEDRQGQPFVGPAGQLLDAMLAAIGLSRLADDAMNSVAFVEPADAAGPNGLKRIHIANVRRNARPATATRADERPVNPSAPPGQLVQPRSFWPYRFAVQSLLQTGEPIGRPRGCTTTPAPVITYHPAYLSRARLQGQAWQTFAWRWR